MACKKVQCWVHLCMISIWTTPFIAFTIFYIKSSSLFFQTHLNFFFFPLFTLSSFLVRAEMVDQIGIPFFPYQLFSLFFFLQSSTSTRSLGSLRLFLTFLGSNFIVTKFMLWWSLNCWIFTNVFYKLKFVFLEDCTSVHFMTLK